MAEWGTAEEGHSHAAPCRKLANGKGEQVPEQSGKHNGSVSPAGCAASGTSSPSAHRDCYWRGRGKSSGALMDSS